MKILKLITLFILLAVIAIPLMAQKNARDTAYRNMSDSIEFKKQLKAYNASLVSISSDFTQVKHMQMLKEPSIAEGIFRYKNGDLVRWEYTTPFQYIIVVADGKISMKNENDAHVYNMSSNKLFSELNTKINGLINGSIIDDKSDFRHQLSENDYFYKMILYPVSKKMKKYFQMLSVFFNRKDISVARIHIIEESGDQTDIRFNNMTINQPLPDEDFIIR